MQNDPILFIDSISIKNEGNENQIEFDSRTQKNKKNLIIHRIEDIKAMLFFKMNIAVNIKTKSDDFAGIVDNIDDEAVFLKEGNGIKKVLINNIEQISIKKI